MAETLGSTLPAGGQPRWYWPRAIATLGRVTVWLAPTFVGFGAALYPASPTTSRALSFGAWPLTITVKLSPRPSGADATEVGHG